MPFEPVKRETNGAESDAQSATTDPNEDFEAEYHQNSQKLRASLAESLNYINKSDRTTAGAARLMANQAGAKNGTMDQQKHHQRR